VFRDFTETSRVAREELASSSRRKTYADAAKLAKTYAEAIGPYTATHPNNTPLLRRLARAAPPAKATAA
jgi:hypothetical protein